MITENVCQFCGLKLSRPCTTSDAADDCTRRPCVPEDPDNFALIWFGITGEL